MYTSSGVNFSSPEHNIEYLGLEPGMKVADLGAGSGGYSLAAKGRVSESGVVYAVDVQQELLERVRKEANSKGLSIEILTGDIEHVGGTKLRDDFVDAVIVANVLFQVDSGYSLALEAKRILKSGGKLMVVDWAESFGGIGPSTDHVVDVTEAKKIFESAGFEFRKEFDSGPHHYGLIFIKK